jgi:hypothetical protein
MITESLFKNIYRGKQGLNKGIPTGIPKLDAVTFGLQRKYHYTIGGDSGAGKSTLAIFSYIYKPLVQALKGEIDAHFLIFSFELSSTVLFAKLLSLDLYDTYGVEVSYEQILSLTSTIDDATLKLIEERKHWLSKAEKLISIVDKSVTPEYVETVLRMWFLKFGKFSTVRDSQGEEQEVYTPKNPLQYSIVLTDHIRLTKSKGDIKTTIDDLCKVQIVYRNICEGTFINVQQLNRGFKAMDRRAGGTYQMIQLDDFDSSSASTQASEVVIAIFYPFREKLSKCEGYNIKELQDSIRILQLIKNRNGKSDKNVGVSFYGSVGYWKELPKPEEINDYEPYKTLLNDCNKKDNVEKQKDKETNFTFTL